MPEEPAAKMAALHVRSKR